MSKVFGLRDNRPTATQDRSTSGVRSAPPMKPTSGSWKGEQDSRPKPESPGLRGKMK